MKIEVSKKHTFNGHKDAIFCLANGIDSNIFYSAGGEGFLVKWDIENPESGIVVAKVNNSVYATAFLKEQNQMLVGQNFEGVHLIDLYSNKEIQSLQITKSAIFDIKTFKNIAFIACGDGEVVWLDIEKNIILNKIKISAKSARCIAINHLLNEVCVGYSDYFIRVYDLNRGILKTEWLAHKNSVFSLDFSPDFKYLLSTGRDAQIKIWDCWEQYSFIDSIAAHLYAVNNLSFQAKNDLFATASIDKTVKIWSGLDFKLLKVIDKSRYLGHSSSANKLLWLSANQLLSAGDDKVINLWEIKKIIDY